MAENEQNAQPMDQVGGKAAQHAPAELERDWKAEYEKVLAQSRKWEQRAKENKDAAAKLTELEDASKTDAERLALRRVSSGSKSEMVVPSSTRPIRSEAPEK